MAIQRKISEEAVLNPNSSVYRDVLTSFLTCTHELVPPPIARTVIERCSNTADLQGLKSLCDLLTRPRMQNLASYEIVRRCLAKLERDAMDDADVREPSATISASALQDFKDFEDKIAKAVAESTEQNTFVEKPTETKGLSSTEQKSTIERPSTSQEIASTSSASNTSSMDDEVMVKENITVGSKRDSGRQSEFTVEVSKGIEEPTAKKTKKSDHQEPIKETKLKDGELSVEEILSTFCPD